MNRPALASFLAVALLVVPSLAFGQLSAPRPPRTFSEFAGTWVRDDIPDNATDRPQPPVPRPGVPVGGFDPSALPVVPPEPKLVITTTPSRITLARTSPTPYVTDVFRFDGVPTNVKNGQGTLTLVAGSVLLTVKSTRMTGNLENTLTTADLLSVSGDVLTIERQWSRAIRPMDGDKVGYIQSLEDGNPASEARVKMVYRRQTEPAR